MSVEVGKTHLWSDKIAKNVRGSENLARRAEENLLKASVASTDIKNKAN